MNISDFLSKNHWVGIAAIAAIIGVIVTIFQIRFEMTGDIASKNTLNGPVFKLVVNTSSFGSPSVKIYREDSFEYCLKDPAILEIGNEEYKPKNGMPVRLGYVQTLEKGYPQSESSSIIFVSEDKKEIYHLYLHEDVKIIENSKYSVNSKTKLISIDPVVVEIWYKDKSEIRLCA